MTFASSIKDIISEIVTSNQARHLIISLLVTDVAHDLAPVLLVSSLLEVKGASNLRNLHFIVGVENIEEEFKHQVEPSFSKTGFLPS